MISFFLRFCFQVGDLQQVVNKQLQKMDFDLRAVAKNSAKAVEDQFTLDVSQLDENLQHLRQQVVNEMQTVSDNTSTGLSTITDKMTGTKY